MSNTDKNNINKFNLLFDDVWSDKLKNMDVCQLVSIIFKYVQSLKNTKNYKFKLISAAPNLKSKKIYDYMPGTGQSEKQFYKYAKAIYEGNITCTKITSEKLLLLLRTYYFDMIE